MEPLSLGGHDNNNNSEKKSNNGGANGTAANGNGGGGRGTAAKAIAEASGGNGNGAAAPLQSEEGKRALVERILGSRATSAVAASLGEMRTMEARAEETLAKTSRRKEELTARRNAIAADRRRMRARMDELRRELRRLEEAEARLAAEDDEESRELVALETRAARVASDLRLAVEARANDAAVDREVRRAVDRLGEFESEWMRSSTASAAPTSTSTVDPSSSSAEEGESAAALADRLPAELTRYLIRARSYFRAEADVVAHLRGRRAAKESEVADLRREMRECASLGGMATAGEIMNRNLRVLRSHAYKDAAAVEALRADAQNMRSDLVSRIGVYGAFDDAEIAPQSASILEGISAALTAIGFCDGGDGGLGDALAKIPHTHNNGEMTAEYQYSGEVNGDLSKLPTSEEGEAASDPRSAGEDTTATETDGSTFDLPSAATKLNGHTSTSSSALPIPGLEA